MVIHQLQTKDAKQFSKLIIHMYEHLHNLEWFTPMPYDIKMRAKNYATASRLFIRKNKKRWFYVGFCKNSQMQRK